MRNRILSTLFLLPLTACATHDDRVEVTEATLTQDGDTGATEWAWYTYLGGLSYEAHRFVDNVDRVHHLDVMDYRTGATPALAVGVHYVDGPAVNGRGAVGDYVGDDGILHGDFPVPWIDLVRCADSECAMADRIEMWADDGGRVHYQAWMAGDVDPSVAGEFLAEPGTLYWSDGI